MPLINCEIELDLIWSKDCVLSQMLRTAAVSANSPSPAREAIQTTSAILQINNGKLCVQVVTLSINDNMKFLENIKQGFRETFSWNKCRSVITTQPKNNNLDYMIDPTLRNINRLFVLSFTNGDDDIKRDSFDKYYMSLVEIKDFYALLENKPFLVSPGKTNKKRMKNLLKCEETMITRQEIYSIICTIKNIINLLV